MRQLLVPTFLVGLCIGWSAFAATLDGVTGNVVINRGDGFQRVVGTTKARAGDLIVAHATGRAILTYEDGCLVKIRPGPVVRVGAKSPCTAAYSLGGDYNLKDGGEPPGFISQLAPFGIGAAAAFTAFCISACGDDDEGRPASP
jgi:hypothetical protein